MTRTMFFLVTEQTFNAGQENEFVGYQIGTKQLPKHRFLPIAEEGNKAVVLGQATNDKQEEWAKQQAEYLAPQYQHMLIDSLLGITPPKIAKKCMDVEYTVPASDPPERVRTSVYEWEQAGFPGAGTHRYHKRLKLLGVETE